MAWALAGALAAIPLLLASEPWYGTKSGPGASGLVDADPWHVFGVLDVVIVAVAVATVVFLVLGIPNASALTAPPRFRAWRLSAWLMFATATAALIGLAYRALEPPDLGYLFGDGRLAATYASERLTLIERGQGALWALGGLVLVSSVLLWPRWIGSAMGWILNLLRSPEQPGERSASSPQAATCRKRCPDCAETVLGAANVCKHCGYRFDDM